VDPRHLKEAITDEFGPLSGREMGKEAFNAVGRTLNGYNSIDMVHNEEWCTKDCWVALITDKVGNGQG
jgi:hypothetical protein